MTDTKKNIDELSDELSNKVVEIEDLNDLLSEKEGEIIRLTEESKKTTQIVAEEKKQTIRQLKGQVDELVKKSSAQEKKIKDLVEKIQLKEAEVCHYYYCSLLSSLLIRMQFTNKILNLKGMTGKEYMLNMRN